MPAEQKKNSGASGRLYILSAALLWGLAGVCIKSITWNGLPIVAVRNLVSLIMLLIARGDLRLRYTKRNLLGALMTSLCGILYLLAIKLTTAGTAIVLQYIAPILVFLFEVIFRGRKPALWQLLVTGAVFSGILLSFSDNLDLTHLLGNILALLSGFAFAAQIIITNGPGSNPKDVAIMSNALSFLVGLPFLLLDSTVSFDLRNILWLLVLGVFQYGAANLCYAKGCKMLDPVECSLLLCVEPIFNPIPVALLCHEFMGVRAVIGAALVISAVTAYSVIPKLKRKKRKALSEKQAGSLP